jgi:chromate reductase
MKPRILTFAGSARNDSLHRRLGREATLRLQAAGAEATFADLRDYPMPLYDGDLEAGQGLPPAAKAFKELVRRQDAIVIASPEYNGSFTALLKNAIDWISRPEAGEPPLAVFRGKLAAIMSASPGPGGGGRGLRHLRELLEMIGVTVIPEQLMIARSLQAFDGEGGLGRTEDSEAMRKLVAGLSQALVQREAVNA